MAKKKAPPKRAATPVKGVDGKSDARTEALARQMGSEFEPNSPSRAKGGRKRTAGQEVTEKQSRKARMWDNRIIRADKRYKSWSEYFDCKHLDDYYEGKQWKGVPEEAAKQKYVINMVFATVETQLPSLLFSQPKVNTEARPDHEFTDRSQASARATLIEQALQTFIDDPKLSFKFETTMGLRDAFSRFGMVEVGYSAEWVDNPNAGKPILDDDTNEPMLDPDADPEDEVYLREPEKVLADGSREMLYLRHIDASTFRASPGMPKLKDNDWVGFYTWERVADLKSNPDYENTENLKSSASFWAERDEDFEDSDLEEYSDRGRRRGMVRVWRIWDLRERKRIVHAEGHSRLLQERPFNFLPLADLRFFLRKRDFYPLPPIYNWMSPQDEINETREMQKVHRRRALRRYMREKRLDPAEVEKLESGEDMVVIEVDDLSGAGDPIRPIKDAPLDNQNWSELAQTEKDLNVIAGVTGEDRNSPNAPTATQANIANTRSSIRESHARDTVATWLGEICRLMLLTIREHMQLPFMVKQSVDPFTFAQSPKTAEQAELWHEIESEDIDDLDVDVKIDVSSLSPVAEEAQRNAWNVVLQLLTNPNLASLLFIPNPNAPDDPSPLLRKTLTLNGIKSDQEIREIWRVGQEVLKQAAQAAQSQAALASAPKPMQLSMAIKAEDLGTLGLGFAAAQAAAAQGLPVVDPVTAAVARYLIAAVSGDHTIAAAQAAVPMPPMMAQSGSGNALEVGGQGRRTTGSPSPTVQ